MLTSYNGNTITYDENGYPLHYNNGTAMDFSWVFGRSLYTIDIGGTSIRYAYDQEGIRTSKTVGNTYTQYHIIDGVMYGEKTTGTSGTTEIFYFYDDNVRMYGFSYNGTMYYYQFNMQGDVTGIYDANGQLVVEYKYDAWGKVLSITGTLANTIGQANPIRYRGYYYDRETGFYHLNSRYYDPETGRFLNADNAVSGTGDSVHGYNLFAYCFNNPINMNDPDGNWPKWIKNIAKTVKKIVNNIVEGVKNSEFDFVNHVSKGHVTSPKLMLDGGPFFGKIGFSTTTTKKNKEEGVLHSYVDIGNDANMCGVGVNVAGWLGAGIGASSEGNIYAQAQATPWVHAQVSLGFDGLGGVVGFDAGDTSYDFEVKAGLGLILIFVAPYALPNGQAGTAYAQ